MKGIVGIIIELGNWLQLKSQSKSGIFVLGVLMGAIPSVSAIYFFSKTLDYKETVILESHQRILDLEKEKDVWQERAFNAESTCLKKLKEMVLFFQEMGGLYQTKEEQSRKQVDKEVDKVKVYENITDKLTGLQTDLQRNKQKDEK